MTITTTTMQKDPTTDSRLHFKSLSNPPSSVFEDGRFIYLPPANSTFFFGRSVAKHNLVKADGGNDETHDENNKDSNSNGSKRPSSSEESEDTYAKEGEDHHQPQKIHPIQIASARIQTHGIAELSKGINLSTLIKGNEYFGLTAVVDKTVRNNQLDASGSASTQSTAAASSSTAKSSDGKTIVDGMINKSKNTLEEAVTTSAATSASSSALLTDENEELLAERKLRSQYILKRKRAQFESASETLQSHYKKLKIITTSQKSIDSRLLELRKRWRLNVPNHNVHVKNPIQPCDVIAVDVDIYSRRKGDEDDEQFYMKYVNESNRSSVLGRVARMVPRFATIELSNNYDIRRHLLIQDKNRAEGNDVKMEENRKDDETYVNQVLDDDTIAQPFLIKESSTSADFQSNATENLPLLTLVFQIEKSSTGFVQSVALSSTITSMKPKPTDNEIKKEEVTEQENVVSDMKNKTITSNIIQNKISVKRDELLIQSLQHSLFCANVFDSIRQEIIQDQSRQQQLQQNQQRNKQSNNQVTMKRKNIRNKSSVQSRQQQVAWLSVGVEDSFMPASSLMAGSRNNLMHTDDVECMMNNDKANRLLSVIYCHEGEIKVQLNSEYCLIIKLVDVNNFNNEQSNEGANDMNGSGSQSPEQLHLLCRLLLLQAQSVYHNLRKEQSKRLEEILQAQKDFFKDGNRISEFVDYSVGINNRGGSHKNTPAIVRLRQQIETTMTKTPIILQSCVSLGAKFILEGKMRKVLKRLLVWCQKMPSSIEMKIAWLSLSVFDPNSRLTVALSSNHVLDVTISGNGVNVSSFGSDGGFRMVHFGTSEEFELFVKHEISTAISS